MYPMTFAFQEVLGHLGSNRQGLGICAHVCRAVWLAGPGPGTPQPFPATCFMLAPAAEEAPPSCEVRSPSLRPRPFIHQVHLRGRFCNVPFGPTSLAASQGQA